MKYKLKDNTGSTMVLAIFSIMIVSLFGIYITKQISQQLTSTKNNYENMQVMYASESGIEKTIYDIENQIYSKDINISLLSSEWINVDHNKHLDTKVLYNSDGSMNATSFKNLVFDELININSNKDTLANLKTHVIDDLGGVLVNNTLKSEFDKIINQVWQEGGFICQQYFVNTYFKSFVEATTKSIELLKEAKRAYELKEETNTVIEAKNKVNRLIGVLEEILCRLDIITVDESDEELISIPISIKLYSINIDSHGEIIDEQYEELNYVDKDKKDQITVDIKYKNNSIQDINLERLNKSLKSNEIYSISRMKENHKIIENVKKVYDIEFKFKDNKIISNINNIENKK